MKDIRKKVKGKLGFVDIETSLYELYSHNIGHKISVGPHQIKKEKKIICINWIIEGDRKVSSLVWDKNQDDKKMLEQFVKVAKKVPVWIGQNSDRFDLPLIKGRLWIQKSTPLINLTTLDTLKITRKNFNIASHKLDYKAKLRGSEGKIKMGWDDWVDVQEGKPGALKKMNHYCGVDVKETQAEFWDILPYVDRLPIRLSALFSTDRESCPMCGEIHRVKKDGWRPSTSGRKQRWACGSCGYTWTDTKILKPTEYL